MTKVKTILIAVFCILTACEKQQTSNIPDVYVNFTAPLNDPRLSVLNSRGSAVTIDNHGVAGLIIYRKVDGTYVAYDRCSSVNPEKRCAITLDNPNLTATDPCSGAKFSLDDGSPVKAPATRSLKPYQVVLSNFQISVTNY